MPDVHRRPFLALVGTAAVAGCIGPPDPDDGYGEGQYGRGGYG